MSTSLLALANKSQMHLIKTCLLSELVNTTPKSAILSMSLDKLLTLPLGEEFASVIEIQKLCNIEETINIVCRFLMEAEDGYMSACDDLKEADNSLEKRKQMLVELERELREYNLKTFINTGFSEKSECAFNPAKYSHLLGP